MSSYGIVGDGRLARHFSHYFRALGISFDQWSRRIGAETGATPADALRGCRTLLVMISDSAIEPWIESVQSTLGDRRFVHFSGALVTDLATGAHPLMTFGKDLYSLEEYRRIPFVCDDRGVPFELLFPSLANPHFPISAEFKARYHALCVMGGNFSVLLWQKMFFDFEERFGIPKEAAFPYLEQITENLKRDFASALTGPLVRGDRQTIQNNIDSLSGDRFQKVYQSFVEAYTS